MNYCNILKKNYFQKIYLLPLQNYLLKHILPHSCKLKQHIHHKYQPGREPGVGNKRKRMNNHGENSADK